MFKTGMDILGAPVRYGARRAVHIGETALELVHPPTLVRRLQAEHDQEHIRWALETLETARRVNDPETVHDVTLRMAQITASGLIRAINYQAVMDRERLETLDQVIRTHLPPDTDLSELGLTPTELVVLQHQLPHAAE